MTLCHYVRVIAMRLPHGRSTPVIWRFDRGMEVPVFEQPNFAANSLNVIFPRSERIRRSANQFEDRLSATYGQPQSIPVPDDLDPQVPRLIFQSLGGHSQIIVSQVSISLNVNYDGDWTTDSTKRLSYLQERVPLVYDLCDIAEVEPAFTGLTGRVRLASGASDGEVLRHLVTVLGIAEPPSRLSEVSLRLSSIVEDRFFDNTTIQSYREWDLAGAIGVSRLTAAQAKSRGVEVIHDFNDRFAFNETRDYLTSRATGLEIVARAQDSLEAWIDRVRKGDAQ